MFPIIAQIAPVAAVRSSTGNAAASRPVQDATRAKASQEAAKNAAREPVRQAPVADEHGLRLTVNLHTHEVVATLVNTQTNEVIRTIPGDETRRAREVIRAIAGQLLDKLA